MSIVLLTGRSGAGKSTLARALCEGDADRHLRERDICHTLATQYGFDRSRDWVRAVGAREVGRQLCKKTVEIVRQRYDGRLTIVDGAYDPALPIDLHALLPEVSIGVVVLEAPRALRIARVAGRLAAEHALQEVSLEEAQTEVDFLDEVKDAFGMPELCDSANLILRGTDSIQNACDQIRLLLA